jgi:hypothetical protein
LYPNTKFHSWKKRGRTELNLKYIALAKSFPTGDNDTADVLLGHGKKYLEKLYL